jgi:hypothetical protein
MEKPDVENNPINARPAKQLVFSITHIMLIKVILTVILLN